MQLYNSDSMYNSVEGPKVNAIVQINARVHYIYGHVMVYLSRKLFGPVDCVPFYSRLGYDDKMSFCLAI